MANKSYERTYEVCGPNNINQIKARISYHKDGFGRGPRGYYLHVDPIESTDLGDGIVCQRYVMFSGSCRLVEPVKRSSQKKFQEAVSQMDELMRAPFDAIMEENDLTLVSGDYRETLL
jgi:hypothetical protein